MKKMLRRSKRLLHLIKMYFWLAVRFDAKFSNTEIIFLNRKNTIKL